MRVDMVPGGHYDLVSNEEMHGHIQGIYGKMERFIQQEVQGVKPIRFTSGLVAAPAINSAVIVDATPQSGYIWAITRVTVVGLQDSDAFLFRVSNASEIDATTSGVPQIRLIQRLKTLPVCATFAKGQVLLNSGEYLAAQFASISATACVTGEAVEVPAEMIGKLLM